MRNKFENSLEVICARHDNLRQPRVAIPIFEVKKKEEL